MTDDIKNGKGKLIYGHKSWSIRINLIVDTLKKPESIVNNITQYTVFEETNTIEDLLEIDFTLTEPIPEESTSSGPSSLHHRINHSHDRMINYDHGHGNGINHKPIININWHEQHDMKMNMEINLNIKIVMLIKSSLCQLIFLIF